MKTEIQKEIGDFNPAYRQAHDFDYWIRIAQKYPIFVIEENLTIMRRFLSSSTLNTSSTTESDTTRYLNEYLLIRNHFFENMDTELLYALFTLIFVILTQLLRKNFSANRPFYFAIANMVENKIQFLESWNSENC